MSEPFKLYRLQKIDTRRDEGLARIAEINALIADDVEMRSVEVKLQAAEMVLEAAKKELKSAEENVRTQENKIDQNQKKLYSGAISNPKELEDLQNEAEALKRYLSSLEDNQLEKMITFENAEEERNGLSDAYTHLIEQTAKRNEGLEEEKKSWQIDVDRLTSEREAALAGIPSEDLRLYEKLRQKKSGLAVTGVAEDSCLACGSRLPHALAQAARSPNKISLCNTCGRILHSG